MMDLAEVKRQFDACPMELDCDGHPPEYTTYLCCVDAEIFSQGCIGYWARGLWQRPVVEGGGWLIREDDGDPDNPSVERDAIRAVRACTPLPEGYYFLGQQEAHQIWDMQLKLFGSENAEVGDYDQLDLAIQWVLLREHRYA